MNDERERRPVREGTNENHVITDRFSNARSERLFRDHWPNQPAILAQYEEGSQCGGCAYFAPFNADWGLCCNAGSLFVLETVFEHYTCATFVNEGWGPHSFSPVSLNS